MGGGGGHQLTNQHATLSASQSMTFSLGGATPGATVVMGTVPMSRSQQVGLCVYINMIQDVTVKMSYVSLSMMEH